MSQGRRDRKDYKVLQGPQGPRGPQGVGTTGITRSCRGHRGRKGHWSTRTAGCCWGDGSTRTAGCRSPAGPQGPQGAAGATGPTGLAGPPPDTSVYALKLNPTFSVTVVTDDLRSNNTMRSNKTQSCNATKLTVHGGLVVNETLAVDTITKRLANEVTIDRHLVVGAPCWWMQYAVAWRLRYPS